MNSPIYQTVGSTFLNTPQNLKSRLCPHITFIDPKGIRNSNPRNDPKMELATSIKDIEAELGDTNTVLNSFILSNTSLNILNELHTNLTYQFFEDKNVLFQVDRENTYIGTMFDKILLKG